MSGPPRVVVEIPLEGPPVVRLVAESAEDERRLIGWLLRSHELQQLGATVYVVLDAHEREAA